MLKLLNRYKFSLAYLLSILAVSLLFAHWPFIIPLADGVTFSPWTALVGAWFVLRDYSQRELGHYVFVPMSIGVATTFLVSPTYGLASLPAAIASEAMDWGIYTFTQRPFHQRVFISSVIGGIVDTLVFFFAFDYFQVIPGISIFNWATVGLAMTSKMLACFYILWLYRKNSPRKPAR